MPKFDKYIQMAKDHKMINSKIISANDIFLDIRAILKCRWGCEDYSNQTIKCNTRNTSYTERTEMIKAYKNILLVHSHDAKALSKAVLNIERAAFLDGYYFSFAIRYCKLCKSCAVTKANPVQLEKVRPCDESFGIYVFRAVRNRGCLVMSCKGKKTVKTDMDLFLQS